MTKTQIRSTVIGGLGLAAVSVLVFLFWPRPVDVDLARIRSGPIAETVSDQGIARVRQSYVVSAPVTGRLERLPLEVGDRVVADHTVVASIRPAAPEFLDPRARAQAEAAVQAAQAALASAAAQRERLAAETTRTSDQLTRAVSLANAGAISSQDLDNAKADATAATNALRAAEADVATRRANLQSAQLAIETPAARAGQAIAVTSPASGIVTHLLQKSERTVTMGTPIVEIGDTAGLEAAIEFLSQDAVKIHPGQRAEIYDWGGAAAIPAEVRLVEPQGFTKVSALGVEEQRTLVILQFAAPPEKWSGLAPGYRVWGRVYLREVSNAILAPLGALVRDHGEWAVFRAEQGRVRLCGIRVGAMTDRDAEVTDGLAIGDEVVLYPSDQVREGLLVAPRVN